MLQLYTIRKEKGYTLQQVADGTGLPRASIGYWESGERKPAADVLPKLAAFYGVTVDRLLNYNAPVKAEDPADVKLIKETDSGIVQPKYALWEVEGFIRNDLLDVKRSFFRIGHKLDYINTYSLYTDAGFENIVDYAETVFGIGKTTTYNLMSVYSMTRDFTDGSKMNETYLPYNFSQLVELSGVDYNRQGIVKIVKPTDTVKDIRQYVKLWDKSYYRKGMRPEGNTVKQAIEIAEVVKVVPSYASTVPEQVPGQTSLFDGETEEPEGNPFCEEVEERAQEDESATEISTTEFYQSPAQTIPHRIFKNADEREKFVRDESNYTVTVIDNAELGLTVKRLDLANGAKIYRSTYNEYYTYGQQSARVVRYCLIDTRDVKKPDTSTCCMDYSLKYYSLDGTSVGYIVKYLTMYKEEI